MRIIILTDERQQLHFKQLARVSARLGITNFEHVWFGLMRLPEGTISTREGKQISLDFTFFECAEMEGYLRKAGYVVQERRERGPYPGIEVETQRCYVLTRKSA